MKFVVVIASLMILSFTAGVMLQEKSDYKTTQDYHNEYFRGFKDAAQQYQDTIKQTNERDNDVVAQLKSKSASTAAMAVILPNHSSLDDCKISRNNKKNFDISGCVASGGAGIVMIGQ